MGAELPSEIVCPRELAASAAPLCRPLPMAAVAALVVNDHFLKGAGILPGWLTGKLSDFAGLAFFPLLLLAIAEPVASRLGSWRHLGRRRLAVGCAAVTAAAFAAIKLHPAANRLACELWGPMVADPTDLVAVPAAFVGLGALEGEPRPLPRWAQAAGVLLAALASIATSAPSQVRTFPAWETEPRASAIAGCAQLEAWVSKSGKQGAGLTVRARNTGERACPFAVLEARFDVGEQSATASKLPLPASLGPFHVEYLYLPFAFDNEALWNQGERSGVFVLTLQAGESTPVEWRVPAIHRLDGLHSSGRSEP